MLDVQDKPKFKKRFSNKFPSNFSKNRNDWGSSLNPQVGRNVDPPKEGPTCGKFGKKHAGECLVSTTSFYPCGKGGHMVKDCPNVTSKGKGNIQSPPSGPSSETPKINRIYVVKARVEEKSSPNILASMLQVLYVIV